MTPNKTGYVLESAHSNISIADIPRTLSQNLDPNSQATAVLVSKLLNEPIKDDIKRELKIFSQQILHRKIRFTACGFFVLDFTLLHTRPPPVQPLIHIGDVTSSPAMDRSPRVPFRVLGHQRKTGTSPSMSDCLDIELSQFRPTASQKIWMHRLKIFSQQILHRKIRFTACEFFVLDFTLLHTGFLATLYQSSETPASATIDTHRGRNLFAGRGPKSTSAVPGTRAPEKNRYQPFNVSLPWLLEKTSSSLGLDGGRSYLLLGIAQSRGSQELSLRTVVSTNHRSHTTELSLITHIWLPPRLQRQSPCPGATPWRVPNKILRNLSVPEGGKDSLVLFYMKRAWFQFASRPPFIRPDPYE
uniref:Gustatory receptor n=1 Tax=Timema californicum TaxID=61474 RepID=A0A7R9JDK3_TIMCA|nr:unnamed protein product [Timema californicum]